MSDDQRRENRLDVNLPVRVLGYDGDGQSWHELTETDDLSESGLRFSVPRPVFRGQCLRVGLPMPAGLRKFDIQEPEYRVYVIVRSAQLDEGICRVGAMFLGKDPPPGYESTPAARFRLPGDTPDEEPPAAPERPASEPAAEDAPDPLGRRAHERFDMFVDFSIEQVDEWGVILTEERTVAENISLGGARLLTAGTFAKGEIVEVHEIRGPFVSRAEIREVKVGADGVRRLHVMFLDASPEHLVRRT